MATAAKQKRMAGAPPREPGDTPGKRLKSLPGRLLEQPAGAAVLIVVMTLLVYANSFSVPYLYDDIASIPENSSIRSLSDLRGALTPPQGTSVAGRPVLNLSFAVSYALSGPAVEGHHLLNVLIHAASGCLLYGLLRRSLRSFRLRERLGKAAGELALFLALWWSLHPVQTESVTYLVQRAEALVSFFYLLLFYCTVRMAQGEGRAGRRAWGAGAVAACALGMGSKELMVTAPVLLFLYDRTFLAGTFREALRSRWWFYVALGATWVIIPLVTRGARSSSAGFGLEGITPFEYARSQAGVILHYLRLSVWPHPLVFHYDWPVAPPGAGTLLQVMLVLGLVGAAGAALRFAPAAGFCGAWFFLILAPTSSIVPIADLAYEHRIYLPLAGVLALLGCGGYAVLSRREQGRWGLSPAARRGAVAAAVVIVAGCGAASVARNRDYRSAVAIWSDTVVRRPDNYKAHYNLAFHLERERNVVRAEHHYRQALRVRPGEREALNSLGLLLARTGRGEEGAALLLKDLERAADPAEVHMNLGLIRGIQKRPEESARHYREALRLKPGLATAHFNLGNALVQLRHPDAVKHYEEAIRLKPDLAAAHINLAGIVMDSNPSRAAEHFRQALETQPGNAKAHLGLGMALGKLGEEEGARRHLEQAGRLDPRLRREGS